MKGNSADFDVLVVGAGPAGLSVAMWCAELGLTSVVLEREAAGGGQMQSIYNPITNYLGSPARNGAELADRFLETFGQFNVPIEFGAGAVDVNVEGRSVAASNGKRYAGRFLVLATGVSRRRLNLPGENLFEQKGILVSGARDRREVAGKIVAVIGGGDAALENALMLSEFASHVYVIHRRTEFSARPSFVAKAAEDPRIEFIFGSSVASIDGDKRVESITVCIGPAGKTALMAVDFVLIRIGVEPNTDFLEGQVDLDPYGYVLVDSLCRTSAAGVSAVGDVANPIAPTIATAAGTGATAAKHIRFLLNSNTAL